MLKLQLNACSAEARQLHCQVSPLRIAGLSDGVTRSASDYRPAGYRADGQRLKGSCITWYGVRPVQDETLGSRPVGAWQPTRVRASVRPRSGRPGTMTLREHADPLAVIGRRLPQCGEQSGIVMDPELGPHLPQQRLHAPHALARLRGIHIVDRHAL